MKQATDMYRFSSKLWFNKRAVNASGEASLYLQVVIDSKHREFNLKLRWAIKFIDQIQGKLLPRFKNDPDLNTYTVFINTEISKHNEINRAFLLRKETLDIQKFTLQTSFFNEKESFAAYLDNEAKRRYQKKEIDLITYKNAKSVLRAIERYDKEPLFPKINKKWMHGLEIYLRNTEYKIGKKYKQSTIWSFLKVAKTYLKLASAEPLIYVNEDAITYENPTPIPETDYLERDELRRLLIIQNNGVLTDLESRVLKGFLFQCYTGLRISDLYLANNQWKASDDYLYFLPYKNRKKGVWLQIPLMGPAKNIVKRATDTFFDLPNRAQFNETLKGLARKAEINKRLISHMGRHTFGFLFMTSIGNILALKELLGHKKIEATQRYAHLNNEYKLQSVRKMAESFMDYTI